MTDPDTGGQKGIKTERFDLIPVWALEEIARVFGWGAGKYEDDNWRRGYSWRLSFGAMMRHAWAFWRGEVQDQESGLHHLSHVAWHCLVMMTFWHESLGTDDRHIEKDIPSCKVTPDFERAEYLESIENMVRRA